ncbi:hypothetical protein [Halalkalicoccus tibetensis]|uniref:Restriction endonuclease n=1 Tax=Halalkalicoccus tibetensis TaxID=175632 RepID=A0ABD5V779_9EURY
MRRALSDLAIWEPADDLAETYLQFRALNERMRDILTEYTGEDIHLWDIEHAFYYWQHREEAEVEATTESEPASQPEPETVAVAEPAETLPSSYIPPIVSILPDLARRTDQMIALAEQNGKTVESLFENRLAVCFRILGYKVEDLGQGSGRNPDGIFTYRGNDSSYAVIYDAKSSPEPYRLRTGDERQFEDYINQHIGELQRRGFDNIYFAVISGSFVDEAREAIRGLKIRMPIREVRLLEAMAVIELLENSLRDPEFRLGPGGYQGVGLQDFFVESGVLTEADVREELGL